MRRPLATLCAPIVLAALLAACGPPPPDEDRCVEPTPSPTGAPWVEWDDGEPCRFVAGGWESIPEDDDAHVRKPKTTKSTRARATRVPATKTRRTS